jgi:hypothetical protein
LQGFFESCPQNVNSLPFVNRAVTRGGIANAFWKWRRGRLPAPAQTRASTTSPETQASDRGPYIVTFLRARNFWRRFIGLIAPALNALLGDPKKVFEASYARMWEAIRALVKRAIKSGDIRKDLDPIDLLRALIGVANVATSPDWQQSARRLVDILITGSRPAQ